MRGPEKSKYLAEVLESVANSEEKLRKVEFELRNRVCGYYKHNEKVSIDVESISNHGKLEKVSKICEPRFENRDRPENLQAFDLISFNDNNGRGILQIHETISKEALMYLKAMKPICSDSKGVGALKVDESKFENNNVSTDFETSDNLSNPCNGEIVELLKTDEQNLESTNGYVTFKSVAHNHLHTGDGEEALQIYLLPQIDRQEVLNHNGHLESLDLIPRRDKINLQNLTLETGTTKAIDLIPRHDHDENDLQIKEKDSGLNQDILNNFEQTVHTNSQIHVGDEKISESLEQKLETDHKKKIQNNNIKVLVDKIHSAVECRLKQCLEPYRSRKQRGPFTLKKIVTEKHLLNGIDKNSFGDGLKKSNSENGGGMEFVEKLFASYYQRERERKEVTEREEIERENDKSQKLSRILDKIASKGLEKLLQGSHINNLTDELKMKKNEKIEEKLESDEGNMTEMTATNTNDETKKENLILTKDGNGAGLKKKHRNRKTKSKKYENYLPTIGEKGESSYENERGNKKKKREDMRTNKKSTAKKFVEKIKSPYKPVQDDKKMKICLKRGGNKMKIVEKGVKEIRKVKKSPYSMSFDIRKRKKQGEPIRKRVIKKGCKKKRDKKIKSEEIDEEQDSKIVCISLRNQEKEECDTKKQNTNEMFDIIKELVFRKNNVQEKVKCKKKKQKKRKEKEEGKEKGEKNVRKKKIDKPVWLVPDGHPDGFQPPKTKHRMSAHKLEFENFSEEDKQNKNSLSSNKFKMRREFVIFLDDKQNNIFGTKSAFSMPLKNC